MSMKKVFFSFLFIKVMSGRIKGIVLCVIIIIIIIIIVVKLGFRLTHLYPVNTAECVERTG